MVQPIAGATGWGWRPATAQPAAPGRTPHPAQHGVGGLRKGMFSFMLASEQFTTPELIGWGRTRRAPGFHVLSTSDHLQPWQANEGHAGQAWVTMGALGAQAAWLDGHDGDLPDHALQSGGGGRGFRDVEPSVSRPGVPGRRFGRGAERAGGDRDVAEMAGTLGPTDRGDDGHPRSFGPDRTCRSRASTIPSTPSCTIRRLKPIPLLAAANGKKSMRLAGQHADGLVTDPKTWMQHKSEWEAGARAAGKNPADMPVLIEQYVVVGDQQAAKQAAEFWRFGPKAFKTLYNVPSPVEIQQQGRSRNADGRGHEVMGGRHRSRGPHQENAGTV